MKSTCKILCWLLLATSLCSDAQKIFREKCRRNDAEFSHSEINSTNGTVYEFETIPTNGAISENKISPTNGTTSKSEISPTNRTISKSNISPAEEMSVPSVLFVITGAPKNPKGDWREV